MSIEISFKLGDNLKMIIFNKHSLKLVFKLFIFIFVSLMSQGAFAEQTSKPEQVIDKIVEANKALTSSTDDCDENCRPIYMPYGEKNSEESLNACAIEICGPPEHNPTVVITDVNFSKFIDKKAIQKIDLLEPLIQEVLEKSKKQKIELIEKLKLSLSEKHLDSIDFSKLSGWVREQFAQKIFSKQFHQLVQKNKPLNQRVSIEIEYPTWATADYKTFLKKIADSTLPLYSERNDMIRAYGIFSNSEIQQMADEQMAALQKQTFEGGDQNIFKLSVETLKNTNANRYDVDRAMENLRYLKSKYLNTEQRGPSFTALSKCTESDCQSALKEYFKNELSVEKLDKILIDLKDPDDHKRAINHCKGSILASQIREVEQATARKQFNQAMLNIEKNLLPNFSEHSRKILQSELAKITLSSQIPSDVKQSALSEGQFKNQAKLYLAKNTEKKYSNDEKIIQGLFELNEDVAKIDESNPCNQIQANAWDQTDPEKKVLKISDYACSHELRGQQIIAHEIAHNINHIFSKVKLSTESLGKYKDIRSCVTDRYQFKARRIDPLFASDGLYSEEDMADLLSNMSYLDDKSIYSCALLMPHKNGKQYQNLSLKNLISSDPHSTVLSRALMEVVAKGRKIPKACQKIVGEVSQKLGFKKCN